MRARAGRIAFAFAAVAAICLSVQVVPAAPVRQDAAGASATYQQIKTFALTSGSADVTSLVLKRDRVEMTFTGTFWFAAPVEGRVTGAVFVGQGSVRADTPPSEFERDNLRRLLGADRLESDFKSAVLRMTDDTMSVIGAGRRADAAPAAAAERLAAQFEPRLLHDYGLNLSARLATSLLNNETPGVFFAEFEGGKRGRFDYAFDPQNRIPMGTFGINGGEKGVVFAFKPDIYWADTWLAFYGQQDYERGTVPYSDANNLVDITHYALDLGLRDPGARMAMAARLEMKVLAPGVRAVSFRVGESLGTFRDARLKNQLRLKSARLGASALSVVQEDWEGGFTVFLPAAAASGDSLTLDLELEGKFLEGDQIPECFYLLSNEEWLPRHGDLDRATFDFTFHHLRRHYVAAIGVRLSEAPDDGKDFVVTKYRMDQPVALAAFAVGAFRRSGKPINWDVGGAPTPLEFNGVSRTIVPVQDGFMIEEMDNAVRYFASVFGKYPYPAVRAVLHPYGFGQGFATLLFLPPIQKASNAAIAFIAHETAHQWWGNVVGWRSYRDSWLSEGFAEYSAMLYAGLRQTPAAAAELIQQARAGLREQPQTATGLAGGRLVDIGPIILGHRLNTNKTGGAYQALIYAKGALVLRMLHFLLSDPASGNDKAFIAMMADFAARYRDRLASTEDFQRVASEHFARSPIAQKYALQNLNWFFRQWVNQSDLPSYTADYELAPQADGSVMVSGTIRQEHAPDDWAMPVPIVFSFPGGQQARTTILASGPSRAFQIKLPQSPTKVELDPQSWVLSEKTTIKK